MHVFSSAILKAFPVPSFLDPPFAGISFSDTFIRCIQFSRDSQISIRTFTMMPVPSGAIVNGVITDKDMFAGILQRLSGHGMWVKAVIPEEQNYLFEIDLPRVEAKDIRSAIEFKIEENIPLPADKVYFDYRVINEESTADVIHAVVSAAPRADLDQYIGLLEAAGFHVLGIEAESSAIARAVLSPAYMGDAPTLIAQFATGKIGLYLISRGVTRFSSSVSVPADWAQKDPAVAANEIRKVAAYWQDNLSGGDRKAPNRVIICGTGLEQQSAGLLAPFLDFPAELANVWGNAFDTSRRAPEIPFLDALAYAPAIGAALPTSI